MAKRPEFGGTNVTTANTPLARDQAGITGDSREPAGARPEGLLLAVRAILEDGVGGEDRLRLEAGRLGDGRLRVGPLMGDGLPARYTRFSIGQAPGGTGGRPPEGWQPGLGGGGGQRAVDRRKDERAGPGVSR